MKNQENLTDSLFVTLEGESGDWVLKVNGSRFTIKGVGCSQAIGKSGVNYLALAKDLGANTVRTWGIKNTDQFYLDQAHQHGLKVDVGIWLPHVYSKNQKKQKFSYIKDRKSLQRREQEILQYIKTYRNHPAVLLWNVGNEVIHFTKKESERLAFVHFLEQLIQKIKKIDPHHPIVYSMASRKYLSYFKKYVPSLDILGVNVYHRVTPILETLDRLQLKKPFLITEAGPSGPWSQRQDRFGQPIEQTDSKKASQYVNLLKEIKESQGSNLGGIVFRLGDPKSKALNWFNLTIGTNKRASFLEVQSIYSDSIPLNLAPIIEDFKIDLEALKIDRSVFSPNTTVTVDISARDPDHDSLTYGVKVWSINKKSAGKKSAGKKSAGKKSAGKKSTVPVINLLTPDIKTNDPQVTIKLPKWEGKYIVIVYVYDEQGHVATSQRTVRVSRSKDRAKKDRAKKDRAKKNRVKYVRSYRLPNTPNGLQPTQSWYSVGSAPDGSIYVGASDHQTNSALYRLRPDHDQFHFVGDAKSASQAVNNWKVGETVEKFHVRPTYLDGEIYIGGLDYSKYNRGYKKKRGFHWYSFDTKKELFEDLSADQPDGVAAQFQLEHLVADSSRNLLYGAGVPVGHLIRYNPKTNRSEDLGRHPGLPDRFVEFDGFMWVNAQGRVYFSMRGRGEFYHSIHFYDQKTGKFGTKSDWQFQKLLDSTKRPIPKMGQWTKDRSRVYMSDNHGQIYCYHEKGSKWEYLGRVKFSASDHQRFIMTRTFQLSPDERFIYMVNDYTKEAPEISLFEFNIKDKTTRILARFEELDAAASHSHFTFHGGYDSWDHHGYFYIASFGMSGQGGNVVLTGINPVLLKQ